MTSKKLTDLTNKLLDTGKRNNLINFKDTRLTTAEVLWPDINTLFEKAENSFTFEAICNDDSLVVDTEDNGSDSVKKEKRISNREEYLSKYLHQAKSKQILLFNENTNVNAVLKSISKRANEVIEETGVNIAYLAFGFVEWTEKENSNIKYNAPILLVPVSIERESIISPFYINLTGDEIILNPTFKYKVEEEYRITLPSYEEGLFTDYLNKISGVVSKLGWKTTSECKMGLFSFQKINMYIDLLENSEVILKNNNVCAILGEPCENDNSFETSEIKHTDNPLIELHNVVDADSSQIEAVEMAKSGKSFVLQGPPGTGKSQTITNIIAECLSDGKKVLFVSEKLAALNVVFEKLKKAELDDFCLELHSNKANKREVIANICHTLCSPISVVSERAEHEIEQKKNAQIELDKYVEELHKNRDIINKSLYQLIESLSKYRDTDVIGVDIGNVESKGEDYLFEVSDMLDQYVDMISSLGYDYRNNCWYGYINQDSSYQFLDKLRSNMQSLAESSEDLIEVLKELSLDYDVICDNFESAKNWQEFLEFASTCEYITPSFLNIKERKIIIDNINLLKCEGEEITSIRDKIDLEFEKGIYDIDSVELKNKLIKTYSNIFSRMFNSEYKEIISSLRLLSKTGKTISYKEALNICISINDYKEKMAGFSSTESFISGKIGDGYEGIDTKWDKLLSEFDEVKRLSNIGVEFGNIKGYTYETFKLHKERFNELNEKIKSCLNICNPIKDELINNYDTSIVDFDLISLDKLVEKLDLCMRNFNTINDWIRMRELLLKIETYGLTDFLNKVLDKNVDSSKITKSYKKLFYSRWIGKIIHESPELSMFNRLRHDKYVNTFGNKDKIQFNINKVQIRSKLSSMRPSIEFAAAGSALQILLREGEKKRKIKSIRKLLEETGELVQQIKPCFLMSPLSVSTYLSSNAVKFDVVIFDEASQIFPQDAIGAIYRGNQLIVVGDSKQMPPTNFFNSTLDDEESDDSEDITDFESILDLCSASFLQQRLGWHYRSRYEQLISFSNKNFYDNSLITFPSSIIDKEDVGVDYYFAEGCFDRQSKTNRKEAEKIVDLVFEHFKSYPDRSLGVVAFSSSQQNLIDKLIYERRIKDQSKEEFFKSEKEEPFFVKNLETVQGDERDTIIFSVAYAKDSQGRFIHNFGPLNRSGGERRLNVAVTRAKHNVKLVASIHHYDIDLSRSQANGTRLLKEYLDYAENGYVALERSISLNPYDCYDSEFEIEVCEFLRNNGYSVDTQVGCSSFKIDLGLRNPDSSDYVLAIECDGASYHSSKNARDRDRLRQEILEGMGWKFYRIWSTDWFKNSENEKKKLLEACENALSKTSRKKVDVEKSQVTSFEETLDEPLFQFPKYVKADEIKICAKYLNSTDVNGWRNKYELAVREILEIEAPLSEEWLLQRTCFYFNRNKVTSAVRKEYEREMYACSNSGIIRTNGFLYLNGQKEFTLRVPDGDERREIEYIAKEELASGLLEVITQNISVEKNGLYLSVAKMLGYSRVGDNAYAKFEDALKLIKGKISINGDIISIKK